jgi:hypothetical protein
MLGRRDSRLTPSAQLGYEYQLMNCDDHQNIIRKNGREIADYRPDITHQVRVLAACAARDEQLLMRWAVSPDSPRQPVEQGWSLASLHPHGPQRAYRSESTHANSAHIQAVCRPHGCVYVCIRLHARVRNVTRRQVACIAHASCCLPVQCNCCTSLPFVRETAPISCSR